MWDSTIVELIDMILAGYEMETDDLVRLLEKGKQRAEGHYLEAKQGHRQMDKGRSSKILRQYISGFANSDGGILLFGVTNDWSVVGFTAPDNTDAVQWATNCIHNMAPSFSPQPRFQTVPHPDGPVLVAATTRSLNLVPVTEGSRQHYYLRFNEETTTMPDWMISDLMLGRRAYPYLHISEVSIQGLRRHWGDNHSSEYLSLDFRFVIGNDSLTWAQDIISGMIAWVLESRAGRISNHPLAHITVQNASPFGSCQPLVLKHKRQSSQAPFTLDPFSERAITNPGWNIPLTCNGEFYTYPWKTAIYIIANDAPPVWYQLTFNVDSNLLKMIPNNEVGHLGEENLRLTKISGGRPIVSWSP